MWTSEEFFDSDNLSRALIYQRVKHLPAMSETQVQSLGWEDHLEKETATHSSTLAWKIHGQRSYMQSTKGIMCILTSLCKESGIIVLSEC